EEQAFTLRLRELSGVIRLAGDLAVSRTGDAIEPEDVTEAIIRGRNVEEQLRDKYGSVYKASAMEFQVHQDKRTDKDLRDVG
ncbi:MAG: Lon protease family protein, partial [Candidatus Micrarchaeota archaeon]|nr:Lon protease family protein [Candidatus Micrarchaeota archaeon]